MSALVKDGRGRKQTDLGAIIEDCTGRAESVEDAAEMILKRVRNDPALYEQLLGPFELRAARMAAQGRFARQRHQVWHGARTSASPLPSEPDTRLQALVRGNTSALMDFPLPGGKSLAKATAADLRDAAKFYIERSQDMGWKGRWLERIAAGLPEGRTVAEKFDEATLASLKEGAAEC